jgi:hypothetical protein
MDDSALTITATFEVGSDLASAIAPDSSAGNKAIGGGIKVAALSAAIVKRFWITESNLAPFLARCCPNGVFKGDASVRSAKRIKVPLKYFVARKTDRGVSVSIDRNRPARFVLGGFGIDDRYLGNNVFQRRGAERLPIHKVGGKQLWAMIVASGAVGPQPDSPTLRVLGLAGDIE